MRAGSFFSYLILIHILLLLSTARICLTKTYQNEDSKKTVICFPAHRNND